MGKWDLVRNVMTAVRSDDDSFDENSVSKGLERPRRDKGRPAEPRPGRPAYGASQGLSNPGPQGGYQSGHASSSIQVSPPQQHPCNGGSSYPNHNAQQAMGTYPSQSNTYTSGYGNNQGHYHPPAQNQSAYHTGSQNNVSGQSYSSQQAASGGHYQQTLHDSQGYTSNNNTYPQQTGASSYGQDWYSQTPASHQHPQGASSSRPGNPYNAHNQSYDGGYPSQTTTAHVASFCEHGRPDDGS